MRKIILSGLMVITLVVPAQAIEFAPHRAVYDLKLHQAKAGSNVTAVSGRMVVEMLGNACEGYTSNFRLVTRMSDPEGSVKVFDVRSMSYEDAAGKNLRFVNETFLNRRKIEGANGQAEQQGNKIQVRLNEPKKQEATKDGSIVFPNLHMKTILEKARAGENIYEARVFDGSDAGEKVYPATALIGKMRPRDSAFHETLKDVDRWPLTITYYDKKDAGEELPSYQFRADMYENGVARDPILDYGEFSVAGTLKTFEPFEVTPCKP